MVNHSPIRLIRSFHSRLSLPHHQQKCRPW